MQLELISKYPAQALHPTPLLFVHGAWHGAWCWDVHFLDYFVQQGFAVHAVSLRGHGQSAGREKLRWTRITHYMADVVQTAAQLPAPPVVIGHSMGGLVVQKYLETHAVPAAVLMATLPPTGVLGTTLRIAKRHPLLFAKVNLTMSLYPIISTPALAREAFFSANMSEEEVQKYARQLQDESYLGFLDMLLFNLPKPKKVTTPLLVLGAAEDTIFTPREVEATAQAYQTQAEMFAGMAHDMMLERNWQAVAERIVGWLTERGL